MATFELEPHRYANLFPLMTGDEYEALVSDIDAHGQHEPIKLYEGKILDGRNRYNACKDLLIEVQSEEFEGEDALDYVLSLNLFRRQMTVAQRAIIAAELSSLRATQHPTLETGRPDAEKQRLAIEEAALALGVSARSVSSASKVVKEGVPELLLAVKAGQVSVSAAEQIAKLEQEAQQDLCTRGAQAIRKMAREMREDMKASKKAQSKPGNDKPEQGQLDVTDPDQSEKAESQEAPSPDTLAEEVQAEGIQDLPGARKPTALLLFELADMGMQEGREPETIAAEILDAVDGGLDLQLLAFTTEVVVKIKERIATMQYRR